MAIGPKNDELIVSVIANRVEAEFDRYISDHYDSVLCNDKCVTISMGGFPIRNEIRNRVHAIVEQKYVDAGWRHASMFSQNWQISLTLYK